MSLTAILLISFSAFLHASWNIIVKGKTNNESSIMCILIFQVIFLLPLTILTYWSVSFSWELMGYVVCSSITNGLYYLFLLYAYRSGNLSIVYPFARSAPIFVVTWVGIFWGEFPSVGGFIGIILIVAGAGLLPLKKFTNISSQYPAKLLFSKMTFFALLTALATSGYSIFDKLGSGILYRQAGTMGAASYLTLEYTGSAIVFLLINLALRVKMEPLKAFKENSWRLIFASIAIAGAYALIVMSYQLAKVSYVVGFRQLSIVIGVVMAKYILHEEVSFPRFLGALVIVAGLVLIALA